MNEIRPGSIVLSRAGRDSGRFLVALRVEGEYAWVADGKLRPVDRPKKKKLRHLGRTNRSIGEPVTTDRRLRRLLAEARLETDDQYEEE